MKAWSVTPLHAILMHIGAKRLETRGIHWKHTGLTAIHATKKFPTWARDLCFEEPFRSVLHAAGVHSLAHIPTGAITCVVDVHAAVSTNDLRSVVGRMSAAQLAFGDFRPNRFAYPVDLVVSLKNPIPMLGQLGLWNVPGPTASHLLGLCAQADANARDGRRS